jgi:hypothetical protein
MKRMRAVLALSMLPLGCELVAGIDDHVYDPNAHAQDAVCKEYCDLALTACVGDDAIYATRETCLGVCAKLPPGDPIEPGHDNTVACRKHQAELAGNTGEPSVYCPAAGPGGAGVCGTNCSSYCFLLQSTCPANFAELPDCEAACATLRDNGDFNVDTDHGGDTLQCRLVHVSSSTVDPTTHCPHTQIHPTPFCVDDLTAAPDCMNFCRFNLAACTGEFASYESSAQCLAVCGTLPMGTNGDRTQNTMGCRMWHTYNALLDPGAHCAHAAPGGDGHCGSDEMDKTGNCESYCILLAKGCATDFAAKYPTQADCQKACSAEPASFGASRDSKYRIAEAASGNTLQCRLLHVSRALANPAECPSALGQGSCQ